MDHGVVLTGKDLGIEDVHRVAVEGATTSLSESCRPAVEASWRVVEEMVLEDKPVYGVNTGVGPLCNRLLPRSKTEALQRNLVRAAPASLHSIPTNANNQDIVTMGGIAALKNVAILENLASLLSIELIGLAQAADIRGRSQDLGEGTSRAYEFVRDLVPFLDEDRSLSEEISELAEALAERRLPVG